MARPTTRASSSASAAAGPSSLSTSTADNGTSSTTNSSSSSSSSPRRNRADSFLTTAALSRRWQVFSTLALVGLSYYIRRSQQNVALINPPFCAWRFVGNHDAWNVAFPDMRSLYHVMQINMNPGDEFKFVAESFPYARYMSYQTYDLRTLMSHESLRDVDIIPENGPNCYANLTAAQQGDKQGGYTIYVTAHGDKNYTNELRAMPDGVETGHFDVFFRIYVEESLQGPPQAPWSHLPPYGKELAFEWGWAPPPKVYIKRAHLGDGQWRELPFCNYRRRKGFKLLAYLSEMIKPPPNPFPDHTPAGPNKQHNVFLPKYSDRSGKFASKDANYIAAVAEPSLLGDEEHPFLWARVRGKLPRVPGSLYTPPYVANATDYDVRYVSLSAVHRTVPFRNHATVADTQIINHYQAHAAAHSTHWDETYTIWVVPPEAKSYPKQVQQDNAIYMKWGASIFNGKTIAYPGLLFRQVMAQSQVIEGSDENPLHPSGVINIVPEFCTEEQPGPHAPEAAAVIASGDNKEMEKYCCGKGAAMECFLPSYVAHRMGPYYPVVEYYEGKPEDETLVMLDTWHKDV